MKTFSLLVVLLVLFGSSQAAKQCASQTDPTALSCGALYNVDDCPDYCCTGEPDDSDENPYDDPSMGCFMPQIPPFVVESCNSDGSQWSLVPGDTSTDLFGGAATALDVQIAPVTTDLLSIKITAPDQNSYSVPESIIPRPPTLSNPLNETKFNVTTQQQGANFELTVNIDDGEYSRTILDLIDLYWSADGQYLQFALDLDFKLSNDEEIYSFGIGENSQLEHQFMPGTRRTLWNNDLPCSTVNESLYGSHPVLYQVRKGTTGSPAGMAHGMILMNSNGMDVSLASDNSRMTFQISGGEIELYIAAGPFPNNVSYQFQNILAYNPDAETPGGMPPYWSFGFHNCKYGYTDIDQVEEVYENYVAANIPYDTQWLDIDYMYQWRDFTYDPVNFPAQNVSTLVNKMIAAGRQYVPIVDPGILVPNPAAGQNTMYSTLTDGLEQNVFVKNNQFILENTTLNTSYAPYYVSQVWPGATLSPDWFNPNTTGYWETQLQEFYALATYRGLWIDMNEFANFCADETDKNHPAQRCLIPDDDCPTGELATQTQCCLICETVDNNRWDFPPFVPHGYYQVENQNSLGARTIVASALHHGDLLEYDVHNMFGLMEAIATNAALVNIVKERPFVLSRSTFLTSGKHTAHWTGDNYADWENLRISIITVNNMGLFNIPMVGADMCGFNGNTTEDLCNRWVSVASYHPFSRDHNAIGEAPQELYIWPSVTECARRNLGAKYTLLPWLNWLFYSNLALGGPPPVQALWQSYSDQEGAFDADYQFTWGGKLLLSPAVFEGEDEVSAFFPAGTWYDYFAYSGNPYDANPIRVPDAIVSTSQTLKLTTPMNHTNVHVKEGTAFMKHSQVYDFETGAPYTVNALIEMSYSFVVALDGNGEATGNFVYDNGYQIDINNTAVNSIKAVEQVVTISPVTEIPGDQIYIRCLEVWAPTSLLVNDTSETEIPGCFSTKGFSVTTKDALTTQTYMGDHDYALLSLCLDDDKRVSLGDNMYFAWGSTTVCDDYERNEQWWDSLETWQQVLFIAISVLIGIACISIIVIFICFVVPRKSDPDAYENIQS